MCHGFCSSCARVCTCVTGLVAAKKRRKSFAERIKTKFSRKSKPKRSQSVDRASTIKDGSLLTPPTLDRSRYSGNYSPLPKSCVYAQSHLLIFMFSFRLLYRKRNWWRKRRSTLWRQRRAAKIALPIHQLQSASTLHRKEERWRRRNFRLCWSVTWQFGVTTVDALCGRCVTLKLHLVSHFNKVLTLLTESEDKDKGFHITEELLWIR